jgi:REP element-mobilizing transposase RayT
MPNHFHFLIRIKTESEVRKAVVGKQNALGLLDLGRFDERPLAKILSKQLSNFFNSYAKAFNKQQNRMGSLFIKNFKRKKIEDMRYMKNLIPYIHNNPVEARMVNALEQFLNSSYNAILNNDNSFLKASEVIEWYNDLNNFIDSHS